MPFWYRRATKTLLNIAVVFIILSFFATYQPVQATCKCIPSGSATSTTSKGTWQTAHDGGVECDMAGPFREGGACNPLAESYINLWFCVPTLGDLIGNFVRIIFFVAGLYALFMLLLAGFEWVSSGGDEKKLTSARAKMVSAVIGLVVMVAVMTAVVLVEQVVFGGKLCLGISCPLNTGKLAIIDNATPGGRASCFGSAPSSLTPAPTGSATTGARLQLTPISTGSVSLTPIKKMSPIIVTATPSHQQSQKRPVVPLSVPPGTRVIILPFGYNLSPTKKIVLPGSGGGGGSGVPRPTVPPLE